MESLRSRVFIALLEAVAVVWLGLIPSEGIGSATQEIESALQEQGNDLMKNVEDMVAHGGMGDANAIVYHCGQAGRYAEGLLKELLSSDRRQSQAVGYLNEVIQQCKRVSEIGPHADPGLLLNPAVKARAAARESIKSLGLMKTGKS